MHWSARCHPLTHRTVFDSEFGTEKGTLSILSVLSVSSFSSVSLDSRPSLCTSTAGTLQRARPMYTFTLLLRTVVHALEALGIMHDPFATMTRLPGGIATVIGNGRAAERGWLLYCTSGQVNKCTVRRRDHHRFVAYAYVLSASCCPFLRPFVRPFVSYQSQT